MPLSLKQLQDVCLVDHADSQRCRYLAQDDSNASTWYCLKLSGKRKDIDSETGEFLREMHRKGQDPTSQGYPIGDNCAGYPVMKYKEQGYDV